MKTILVEEHFMSPGFAEGPGHNFVENAKKGGEQEVKALEQLTDVGKKRITAMDEAGIDMQVLSISSPGVEQLEASEAIGVVREANDFLADAIQEYPERFAGFAILPTAAPDKAVEELDLMVHKHGFRGALINGHIKDRYLDDKCFWPILECAEKLDVPIYLHPTPPLKSVKDIYYGGFSPQVTNIFAGAGWGWHIETAVHVLRLILSGAFDEYPKLQIIIGHMGEALPFMLERIDNRMSQEVTGLKRRTADYLRENVYYTFGGFNFTPTFLNLLCEVGAERIMFSADHPHGSMAKARAFLEQLPVSPADRERIAHGNAEHLLKL
ncbi:MAG: amidohydrolase [Dehalococcoidales bacterium]|nr:amidohydrolase [Dehalococcoidales bacterium]